MHTPVRKKNRNGWDQLFLQNFNRQQCQVTSDVLSCLEMATANSEEYCDCGGLFGNFVQSYKTQNKTKGRTFQQRACLRIRIPVGPISEGTSESEVFIYACI